MAYLYNLLLLLLFVHCRIYCFVDSIDHHQEQIIRSSFLFWLNKNFFWFDSFHIFDTFTSIFQDTLTLFTYYFLPYFLLIRTTKFIIFSGEWIFFIWKKWYNRFHIYLCYFYSISWTHNYFLTLSYSYRFILFYMLNLLQP